MIIARNEGKRLGRGETEKRGEWGRHRKREENENENRMNTDRVKQNRTNRGWEEKQREKLTWTVFADIHFIDAPRDARHGA